MFCDKKSSLLYIESESIEYNVPDILRTLVLLVIFSLSPGVKSFIELNRLFQQFPNIEQICSVYVYIDRFFVLSRGDGAYLAPVDERLKHFRGHHLQLARENVRL